MSTDVTAIIDAARRRGIEMNEQEARAWMGALAGSVEEMVTDDASGVFGARIVMLDFSADELSRFRRIADIVGFADVEGRVETALALSGSAAQSKIQRYPGDCDFFERVNIRADSREEACAILSDLIREKAMATSEGPGYRLMEVKYGEYPFDMERGGTACRKGTPITWSADEVASGRIEGSLVDGDEVSIRWVDVAAEPGWCKLDWVVADPKRGGLANASNMLDATWEGPDGSIEPLDGYLDGYFQEVYLEADSIPLFTKLRASMTSDALDHYVDQLEGEVRKYVDASHANYGKAAKRLYNVFRLTGRIPEAVYVRELFDEPAALLYQVNALLRTVDDALDAPDTFDVDDLLDQVDALILEVISVLEGVQETEVIRHLLHLERALVRHGAGVESRDAIRSAQGEIEVIVNNFFHERLTEVPAIAEYLEGLGAR